jgi:hypothetical protein
MTILFTLIRFIVGLVAYWYLFGPINLMLFYYVPESISLFLQGKLKFRGVLHQLFVIAIQCGVVVAIVFISELVKPRIASSLLDNPAFSSGLLIGFVLQLISYISPNARRELREDFHKSTFIRFRRGVVEEHQSEFTEK